MKVTKRGYECACPWPDDCMVQSGDSGVVFRSQEKGGSYSTAFFEAFPKTPDCFIRGEGETVRDAEAHAYGTFLRYQACDHDFERLNKEGRGRCRHCRMQIDDALPSEHRCVECQTENAVLPSPFGSYLDEKDPEYSCFSCYASTLAPRYLAVPLDNLAPSTLSDDRDEAQAWYAEALEDRIASGFAIAMDEDADFSSMNEMAKRDALDRMSRLAYHNIARQKMPLIEKMISVDAPGVRFLDEGGLLEAACAQPVTDRAAQFARLVWLKNNSTSNPACDDDIQDMFTSLFSVLVREVVCYANDCEKHPPEGADKRKRVPTSSEFKSALLGISEALAKSTNADDDEKPEETDA